jgi:peptide/nickel transport system substrate-binding protein
MADESETAHAGASNSLSRKAFLGRSVGAALALGVPAAFSPTASAAYRATRLRKGGVLRVGSADQETGLSPWKDALANYPYFNQLYGQPFRDFNQPNAADPRPWDSPSISFAADGKSATVRIRPGITFHSGAPLDAKALVTNLEQISQTSISDWAGTWQQFLGSSKAINSNTVQMNFTHPTSQGLVMEVIARASLISPALLAKGPNGIATGADGTGAFKLQSTQPGVKTVLERNPNYWIKGAPILDGVEFTGFTNSNAMAASLVTGELDMVFDVPTQQVPSLRGKFQVSVGPPWLVANLQLSSGNPDRPFYRKAARQAFQYIVDRKYLATNILNGYGAPTYAFVPPSSIAWKPAFNKMYSYNPAIAKSKFKALGMLNSKQAIQIVQLTGILPYFGLFAEKIWQDMSAIGMNVELVPVDISEYTSLFSGAQKGQFDIMPGAWGTVNQYPLLAVSGNSALKVGPKDNMAWWPSGNPPAEWINAVDALGKAHTPAAERAAALHLTEVFLDGSWALATAFAPNVTVMAKNLHGLKTSRAEWLMFENMYFS